MIERTPTYDFESSHESTPSVLVCPDCSTPLSADGQWCPASGCDALVREREGILSLLASSDDSDPYLSKQRLEDLATETTNGSVRTAAEDVLDGHDDQLALLSELFDVRRDLWHVLVAEHIGGRCLDLDPGYGRRPLVLAEHASEVYAVDPSLARLRILAGRSDYASADRVVPIHTTDERLPLAEGTFDTIIADFTGKGGLESRLDHIQRYLATGGSVIFTADGWPTNTPLANVFGSSRQSSDRGELRPGTASGYRSLAHSAGFDDVSIYSLFPTAARPLYAFDINSDRALETILGSYANNRGRIGDLIATAAGLVSGSELIKHCYPTYLIVCTNESKPPTFEFADPLVIQGRTRTVVLDMDDEGIDAVWKIPNKKAHRPYTSNENAVLAELESTSEDITSTLPDGEAIETRFGPVRKEAAVDGRPLEEEMDGSVESFERVLRRSFDWLIEFQQTFRSDSVVRPPETVHEDLTFEPADLTPPPIDESVETFTTPVHGDYMPGNIHHEDWEITSVIDWEYGSMSASPVVDAGFLLLNVASWMIQDFPDRVQTMLCTQNEYSKIVRACVRDYCDAVGLPYRTFELYLPAAYIHRVSRDWNLDAVTTYTDQLDMIIQRTEVLLDAIDEMIVA